MPVFDLNSLAAACGGAWRGVPTAPVTGFSIDTRSLVAGDLFVALRTEKRDGHDFLGGALAHGAVAALVSHPVVDSPLAQLVVADTLVALHAIARAHRRRFEGAVVGVTGSAGKTSTKDLLALLLGAPGEVLATEGNLNNHLGVPLTLLRSDPRRDRRIVAEAGISGAGEMDVIAALIEPDVAVVTMVGPAHLDGLGTVENVAQQKARLAAHVRAGGVAVFPASCLEFAAFREMKTPALVAISCNAPDAALPPRARAIPFAVGHDGDATVVCVTWDGSPEEFRARRLTSGMAGNAVLAIIAALHLGVDADAIRARLPLWRAASMRGEVMRVGDRTIYLDCYNANPSSMADALEGFVALARESTPRLFVVGSMEELGADSAALHRASGERMPLRAGDTLIVFGTHATSLADGARTRAPQATILVEPDRAMAARAVREFHGAIFLKGSRRYALENLLGTESVAPARNHGVAA